MKDRTLTYLSLALSTGALIYAIWIHLHAKQLAAEALHRRELELITHFIPSFKGMYSGMLEDPNNFDTFEPKTLEELFRPMTELMNRVNGSGTNDSAQRTPK
jgi:hypothetical protein